jgi:hypothetical protein
VDRRKCPISDAVWQCGRSERVLLCGVPRVVGCPRKGVCGMAWRSSRLVAGAQMSRQPSWSAGCRHGIVCSDRLTAMATSATPEEERRCSPWPFPSPRPFPRGRGRLSSALRATFMVSALFAVAAAADTPWAARCWGLQISLVPRGSRGASPNVRHHRARTYQRQLSKRALVAVGPDPARAGRGAKKSA